MDADNKRKGKKDASRARPGKAKATATNPTGGGRLPSWTLEREEKVLAGLMRGHTRKAASVYAGISDDTFARWLRGEAMPGRELLDIPGFAERVKEAEFFPEDLAVDCVTTHIANGNLRAAQFYLSTRRPHEWGRQDRETLPLESLSDEELIRKTLEKTPGT